MSDKKISQLTPLLNADLASDDALAIVDAGSSTTKKISVANLFGDSANGVVYLNGSKVSKAASTFVFDGTSVGIGTGTPAYTLDVTGSSRTTGSAYFTSGANVARIYNDGNLQIVGAGNLVKIQSQCQIDNNIFANGGSLYGNSSNGFRVFAANSGTDRDIKFHSNNSTERMRVGSTGDVSVYTGNLVIGTSGKGIDFSADGQAAGMTSELLDDYEEGTWTPTQGSGLTVIGDFSSSGVYTKIGRQVTVLYTLSATVSMSATGVVELFAGLPYVGAGVSGFGAGTNASGDLIYHFQVNSSSGFLEGGNITATPNLYGSITYLTT